MKKLVLFGTRHYREQDIPAEIKNVLTVMVNVYAPRVLLEEWAVSQGKSGAAAVCEDKGLTWKNVGTPDAPEFKTDDYAKALDMPDSANIERYGPILVQQKREIEMCKNIAGAMSSIDVAVVVIGIAHLHSMFLKLSGKFDVDAFTFKLEGF